MTQPSSVRLATVPRLAASLPAPGSLSANAPVRYSPLVSLGKCSWRCASLPKACTTSPTMFVTAMVTAVEAHARAISRMASAYETTPASAPP